ncbi:MAG TPA: S41 family peptidase [Planctomycetota bacterium]|nr:S41 family peptidase [Planctomycetota bacterium]
MRTHALLLALCTVAPALAQDREILLPRAPRVSPDGARVAFAWRGDVWVAPSAGGHAVRATTHPGEDDNPVWSPDGKHLAFTSNRAGGNQIFVVTLPDGALPADAPRQVTFDSEGKSLIEYTADGAGLVVAMDGDEHFHGGESRRLYRLDAAGRQPKRLLLDVGFGSATLSPDGRKVLFTRGRASWWRKGYVGAAAEQIWLADLAQDPPALTRLSHDRPEFQNVSEMAPMWAPGGDAYYFVSDPDGTFDVYQRALDGGAARRITHVGEADGSDDGVAFPSLSADGKTLLVRRRFTLQNVELASAQAKEVRLLASGDQLATFEERRTESRANAVAFTNDGKQMAFMAGEDVYVMDRVLREPVRVTHTPSRETDLVFSADGKTLWFVSDAGGEMDVWRATCPREDGIWWLGKSFELAQVTDDRAVEGDLALSPKGDQLAYSRDGDLFVMNIDGTGAHKVLSTWSGPEFDWSPDGKWITWATQDDDYNSDVWIAPLDGSRAPFNLSRHPGRDSTPRWSPDGTRIAFVGQREDNERDVFYVNLTKDVEEKTGRDRKLEEALEAMKKKPGRGGAGAAGEPGRGGRRGARAEPAPAGEPAVAAGEKGEGEAAAEPEKKADKAPVVVTVDFDGLLERRHRISVPDSAESGLLWSPDGKKLAFSATVDNEPGFYTVEFPEVGKPKRLARQGLSSARWLEPGAEIVGLVSGAPAAGADPAVPPGLPPGFPPRRLRGFAGFGGGSGSPAAMNARGDIERFDFSARQVRDWARLRELAFDQGWRAMRDRFYDEAMNNRDWNQVRGKYRTVAAECLGREEFSDLMNMMLGELNASHMGHSGGSEPMPQVANGQAWNPVTYQLGLRFEHAPGAAAPGLRVRSVVRGGPCAQARSRVEPGETVMAVDGTALDAGVDIDTLLTMDELRDVELTVRDAAGAERKVSVRPIASLRALLYDEWVENTRAAVEKASGGKLGYLHIRSMDMRSLQQMEEDLYAAGAGKDGLIVDIRWNGGGSTADHVLTILTQPVHAITRSRGSGDGYPVDRKVYATWSKPVVLMCNEYSFSNAEILSHAIKQLGRGRLVGMRTGGGVISTGSQSLVDGSTVRMPTRGWYLVTTGADMELNGCMPDIALWNLPGGGDQQLAAAISALAEDVAAERARGRPEPVPAAAKRREQAKAGGGAR